MGLTARGRRGPAADSELTYNMMRELRLERYCCFEGRHFTEQVSQMGGLINALT